MAWSITELANYNEASAGTTSKTTGTLSIPANSVIVVFAQGSSSSGSDWSSATIAVSDSVDGTSNWNGLDSLAATSSNATGGGQAFYKKFTSAVSRTITVTKSNGTCWWGYSVVAITGQDTTNPIVQAKGAASPFWNDAGNSHSQSVTLSASPTSGNAVLAFLGVNNDLTGAATPPSGYTTLDLPTAQFLATSVVYHTATATATQNWSDCGESIEYAVAFAVEVQAAPVGTAMGWVKPVIQPAFAAFGSEANDSSGSVTSVAPGTPYGLQSGGSLILAYVWGKWGGSPTSSAITSSGSAFTLADFQTFNLTGTSIGSSWWYQYFTGSDPGSYTFNLNQVSSVNATAGGGYIVRITGGPGSGNPFAGTFKSGSVNNSTDVTISTFTPATDCNLMVAFAGSWQIVDTSMFGPATGWTADVNTGASPTRALVHLAQNTAAATGLLDFSCNTSAPMWTHLGVVGPG